MNSFKFREPDPPQSTDRTTKSNGLLQALHRAYSWHTPVEIRPDDVMNSIACIWSKYIVIKAEQFRDFFVSHADKKTLTYEFAPPYHLGRIPEFMDGLTALVKEDQDNDNLSWMEYAATTTTPTDNFIRRACGLASQKEYYDYRCSTACGFSTVTLLGTDQDWDALEFAISIMPTPDDHLAQWQARLLTTIHFMRSGSEDFWQRCVSDRPFGSGADYFKGWIVDFNPIDEKGKWLDRIERYDILDLTVDFPIEIIGVSGVNKVEIQAGITGCDFIDGALKPVNTFSVLQTNGKSLFTEALTSER